MNVWCAKTKCNITIVTFHFTDMYGGLHTYIRGQSVRIALTLSSWPSLTEKLTQKHTMAAASDAIKRAKYVEIDLDDTDGDSDGEECETDEYEEDGFITHEAAHDDGTDGDVPTPMLATPSMDERSDVMWAHMLRKQADAWLTSGKEKRWREELEYKLRQFKTPRGIRDAIEIANHYGLNFRKPPLMAFMEKYCA